MELSSTVRLVTIDCRMRSLPSPGTPGGRREGLRLSRSRGQRDHHNAIERKQVFINSSPPARPGGGSVLGDEAVRNGPTSWGYRSGTIGDFCFASCESTSTYRGGRTPCGSAKYCSADYSGYALTAWPRRKHNSRRREPGAAQRPRDTKGRRTGEPASHRENVERVPAEVADYVAGSRRASVSPVRLGHGPTPSVPPLEALKRKRRPKAVLETLGGITRNFCSRMTMVGRISLFGYWKRRSPFMVSVLPSKSGGGRKTPVRDRPKISRFHSGNR